jgi:hypothetical protein
VRPDVMADTAVTHFFALSPSSTRRRMASEGVSFRSDAHALTAAKTSGGTRAESNGLMPVVGRPGFFLSTDIAFFIVIVYKKSKPRGSLNFRPGSNPSHQRG